MILSHKIELDTTHKQREYFARCCGTARFVWNRALSMWSEHYEAGDNPSGMSLMRVFNQDKYELYPWLKGVHRDCHSQPFANLQKAFVAFFNKTSKRPTFKKKGKCRDSFYVANDKFRVEGESVVLPKIGRVRLTESLRFTGKIMSAVVSRTADRWFISIQVDIGEYSNPRVGDGVVGVDLGLKTAVTLSTGEQIHSPRPLKAQKARLRRAQRKVSRRVKGSKNRAKATKAVARIHAKIANIRNDWLHKATTRLVRENQTVVVEDLAVQNMQKNRRLSPSICDMGWFEFRRQLSYKSGIYRTNIVVADRWYPSSKTCSSCGWIDKSLTMKDRTYECDSCGLSLDRDVNAAINLRTLGLSGIACGSFDNPNGRNSSGAERVEAGTKPCPLVGTH